MSKVILADPRPGPLREIPIWIHVPAGFKPASPITIVMHGMSRNADAYLAAWAPLAEQHGFAVAAPEFSAAHYPQPHDYNYGNMVSTTCALLPRTQWLFPVIDLIFETVRAAIGSKSGSYCLYGHSAGGQLVHRLVTFAWSARIALAITANAGSYTMPTFDVPYPFGLGGTAFEDSDFPALLSRPLVVLLGDSDTDPHHHNLPRQPEAQLQGPHRYARGQYYAACAERIARDRNLEFKWRTVVVPGVAHSNPGMAPFAAALCADTVSSRR